MNHEILLRIGGSNEKAFLQNGFLRSAEATARIFHRHNYPEIHLIGSGCAAFRVDADVVSLMPGQAILVPAGVYHCCDTAETGATHVAFQTTAALKSFAFSRLPCDVLDRLAGCIPRLYETADFVCLSGVLALICTSFLPKAAQAEAQPGTGLLRELQDPAVLIDQFISKHYHQPVKLCDLAAYLNYSEKHTERLVKKHTGFTFRDALTEYRLKTADFLAKTTAMPLTEIAAYVGYAGYSGFWKARKAFAEKRDLQTAESVRFP